MGDLYLKSTTMSLSFSTTYTELIVRGNTFLIKEDLKKAGARWNIEIGAWCFPISCDSISFRNLLKEKVVEAKEHEKALKKAIRLMAFTPEGIAAAAILKKKAVADAYNSGLTKHWMCCANCKVIDWERQHTSCMEHAVDGNSFRVRGMIRTGN